MVTLLDEDQIKAIQILLGVKPDGIWGPKTQAALDKITAAESDVSTEVKHDTYASSFADPDDVDAFNKCKAQGKSDQECFKVGDNGIGCWGQSTVEGTGPSCALPPETMTVTWGSKANAKNKRVMVERYSTKARVECTLKDQMPSVENLANKATIDLNPDACILLGIKIPAMERVVWWAVT